MQFPQDLELTGNMDYPYLDKAGGTCTVFRLSSLRPLRVQIQSRAVVDWHTSVHIQISCVYIGVITPPGKYFLIDVKVFCVSRTSRNHHRCYC